MRQESSKKSSSNSCFISAERERSAEAGLVSSTERKSE